MPKPGFDISQARILVTNDDGIHAPGLEVLQRVARSLSRDVWVVAPEAEQSGSAHSLTLRRPLRERRLSPRRFAIDGTPTDCVLLAVNHIIPKRRPDLILSGINRGSNLGEDVTYSGTIAAAMEGALLGVPSNAFEVAMLYGIQRGEQLRLVKAGRTVRVLISYGAHWFPWYMRRLAERPANLLFVAKSMFAR